MELAAIIIALIVPIGIAIWTVRSSAKDTAKQIAALEESTQKQVESVKELAKIQTKIAALQLEKESWEARHKWRQLSEENFKAIENDHSMAGFPMNEFTSMMHQRSERNNHLALEQDFYSKQVSLLDGYNKRIKEILKELDNS
jgi:hypothetical protein